MIREMTLFIILEEIKDDLGASLRGLGSVLLQARAKLSVQNRP